METNTIIYLIICSVLIIFYVFFILGNRKRIDKAFKQNEQIINELKTINEKLQAIDNNIYNLWPRTGIDGTDSDKK